MGIGLGRGRFVERYEGFILPGTILLVTEKLGMGILIFQPYVSLIVTGSAKQCETQVFIT
jgi:hypothetical protein